MKDKPRVSVILPAYNGERFIGRSIKSVLSQSMESFELIVIDDGSVDDTNRIIREFVGKDARVRCLSNKGNLGIQKTLNIGIKESRSEYIARIDDDDEWSDKDKLRRQVDFLDSNKDYVLVGTGAVMVDEKGKELFRFVGPSGDAEIRDKMLFRNCFMHASVMFRRDAALAVSGYDEREDVRHIEDYDLWLKLGIRGKMKNLPIYAVKITLRKGNISSVNKIKQFKRAATVIRKFKDSYPHYLRAVIQAYVRLGLYAVFRPLVPAAVENIVRRAYKRL